MRTLAALAYGIIVVGSAISRSQSLPLPDHDSEDICCL